MATLAVSVHVAARANFILTADLLFCCQLAWRLLQSEGRKGMVGTPPHRRWRHSALRMSNPPAIRATPSFLIITLLLLVFLTIFTVPLLPLLLLLLLR